MIGELLRAGLIPHPDALTVTGNKFGDLYKEAEIEEQEVIRPIGEPLTAKAGFLNLSGNLFDTAIMKTSVIDDEFRNRYLSNPN